MVTTEELNGSRKPEEDRSLIERQEAALARLERLLDAVEAHPIVARFLGLR